MITQQQPLRSARIRLGQVIRHAVEKRGWNQRKVGDICCSVPRETVDNWYAGAVVPDGRAWDSLKHVSHGLAQYSQLRQEALLEADVDRKQTIERREKERQAAEDARGKSTIGTNLGDKIAPVLTIVAPTPAAEPKERPVAEEKKPRWPVPPGALRRTEVRKREAFVRSVFMQRPHIRTDGPDGMREVVRARFGIGVTPERIDELRDEMIAGNIIAEGVGRAAISQPIEEPMPHQITIQKSPDDDIKAAVRLVLEAIPSLASFTIAVDDKGAASVSYTTRELRVVENTGSFTVSK
jgi:hypothetical protein